MSAWAEFKLEGLFVNWAAVIISNNEKKRKRAKRNEIQCMILFKSELFVFIRTKFCYKKDKLFK